MKNQQAKQTELMEPKEAKGTGISRLASAVANNQLPVGVQAIESGLAASVLIQNLIGNSLFQTGPKNQRASRTQEAAHAATHEVGSGKVGRRR